MAVAIPMYPVGAGTDGRPPTTETVLYTAPAAGSLPHTYYVREIIAANQSGAAATFSLSVVRGGGLGSAANRIFGAVSVAANQSMVFECNTPLFAGDTLSGLQGTANAITLTISGQIDL